LRYILPIRYMNYINFKTYICGVGGITTWREGNGCCRCGARCWIRSPRGYTIQSCLVSSAYMLHICSKKFFSSICCPSAQMGVHLSTHMIVLLPNTVYSMSSRDKWRLLIWHEKVKIGNQIRKVEHYFSRNGKQIIIIKLYLQLQQIPEDTKWRASKLSWSNQNGLSKWQVTTDTYQGVIKL